MNFNILELVYLWLDWRPVSHNFKLCKLLGKQNNMFIFDNA